MTGDGGARAPYPERYRVDPWVEHWYRLWEAAYTDHHPITAAYALARGSLRALRVDLGAIVRRWLP